MNLLEEARALAPRLSSIREDLHRHPELGNQEKWTSAFITEILEGLGIQTVHLLETAVIGILDCGEGPAVALRADMDALPVDEATGCSFMSQNPRAMHACGHDVHMTSVLGAVILLSSHRSELRGKVYFVFQPDEEGRGGAQRIVDSKVLSGVSAVYGGHVCPDLPSGTIGIRYGKFYAASDVFTVTVKGKSAHGATPEKGRDALLASAEMVYALSLLKKDGDDPFVLTVGTLNSGRAINVISDNSVFTGILRTLGHDNRREMKERMKETCHSVALKHGVEVEVVFRDSYGGIVNTEAETDKARKAAEALLGREGVVVLEEPTMTTEDFGVFTDAFSGSFVHFGTGGDEPLHSPRFLPSPEVPVLGAAFFAELVLEQLA